MSEIAAKSVYDVLIIGAGLAGLTLANQLLDKDPSLNICIVHNRRFPYPERIHKVGESSVEIGAHYLSKVIGLEEHLNKEHLRKMGLRFILTNGEGEDATYNELGLSCYGHHPSFQIDRGRLENHLKDKLGDRVTLVENSRVLDIEKQDGHNMVLVRDHDGIVHTRESRWVVDASGRGRVLMKKFGLQKESAINHSAVWFRVAGNVDINEFLNAGGKDNPFNNIEERGRSTTHLVGKGYWVWIIPINQQTTSIGIVFDNNVHRLAEMSSYPLAMDWLKHHEPSLHTYLERKAFEVLDFVMLRNYSYLSSEFISEDGWAVTGEAAGFIDPMYSNGTDMIGIANTLITNVITSPDGIDFVKYNNQILTEVYGRFEDAHRDSYIGFDDWSYVFIKTNWDTVYYFLLLCVLFMNGKFEDVKYFEKFQDLLAEFNKLNHEVLSYLRQPDNTRGDYDLPRFIDLVGSIQDYSNREITLRDTSDEAVTARIKRNFEILRELGLAITETKTFDDAFFNMKKRLDEEAAG